MGKKISDKVWTVEVQVDGRTKQEYIEFPQEVIDQVGWDEGDTLLWEELPDGSGRWQLTKQEDKLNTAKIVSYSQPDFDESLVAKDVQELIAYCARVSNPSNQMNHETSEKLIKYLIKHKHWSPLEMVSVCLEITTTRDIAHQIVRHRSFSFQEFSQRYANPQDMDDAFVVRECRMQDEKNRQNSIETNDAQVIAFWEEYQKKVIDTAKNAYDWAISKGIAKEQARAVLPEGCTKTKLYMNGTLRSWVHYIELRSENGTQKEHMDVAVACAKEIAKIFPLMMELK